MLYGRIVIFNNSNAVYIEMLLLKLKFTYTYSFLNQHNKIIHFYCPLRNLS